MTFNFADTLRDPRSDCCNFAAKDDAEAEVQGLLSAGDLVLFEFELPGRAGVIFRLLMLRDDV